MDINIIEERPLQIFDLGNVLVDVDARRSVAALQALGLPRFEGTVSNSHAAGGFFSLYADGKISTPEFIREVRTLCGNPSATDAEIVSAWNAMIGSFRPGAVRQVKRLRDNGHSLALLSNCNELHTIFVRQLFAKEFAAAPADFDALFHALFFSQEIGMSKPEPRAWTMVLDHFGLQASQAAFYDDSPINVEAAQRLGIAAVVVEQPAL